MIDLDAHILKIQNRFTAKLFVGLGYVAYHRAFVNLRDGRRIPETQTAGTKDYVDRLLDTSQSQSFFVVDDNRTMLAPNTFLSKVYIYFAVNLDILYPSVTERAEEHLMRDVYKMLRYTDFEIEEVKTGLKSFTDDFDFIKEGDNMEPYFLCRFQTLINYSLNEC